MMKVVYDITRLVDRYDALNATGVDRVDLRYALWLSENADQWRAVYQRPDGFEDLTAISLEIISELKKSWIDGKVKESLPNWKRGRENEAKNEANLFVLNKLSKISIRDRWKERKSFLDKCLSPAPRLVTCFLKPSGSYMCFDWSSHEGWTYWNVGHSFKFKNCLTDIPKGQVKQYFFIHDLIPLVQPESQKKSSTEHFRTFCQYVDQSADVLLSSSECNLTHDKYFGKKKKYAFPLAVEDRFTQEATPIDKGNNYLSIGTIEPRKNIALLLDVWEQLAKDLNELPILRIVGKRLWSNDDLYERIDQAKRSGWLEEYNDASDEQLLGFLREAKALLFPSKIEGWGIPLVEALAVGTPVVCRDTPLMREVTQGVAEYCRQDDSLIWARVIQNETFTSPEGFKSLRWEDYFKEVNKSLGLF